MAWSLGHHGVGNMNSSGLRLLSLCSELGHVITDTFFQLRDMHRTSSYFFIRRLQFILGLPWWHNVTHSEIRSRAGIPTIESMLHHRQLRCLGHVIGMPHCRLPHCVLHGQLRLGRRSVGGQTKRSKDHMKSIRKN